MPLPELRIRRALSGLALIGMGTLPAPAQEAAPAVAPVYRATETIEAERFTQMYGVEAQPCSEGGLQLGSLETDDWILFRQIDFGTGVRGFAARVRSRGEGGRIELRFGDLFGPVLGTIEVPPVERAEAEWVTLQSEIWKITGAQPVCLRFVGPGPYDLNWITFTATEDRPGSAPAAPTAETPPSRALPTRPGERPRPPEDAAGADAPSSAEATPESPAESDLPPSASVPPEPPGTASGRTRPSAAPLLPANEIARVTVVQWIEAESWSAAENVVILPTATGGFSLQADQDGAWARYAGVELEKPVGVFLAQVATMGTQGSIELRAGDPDGRLLAVLPLRATGGLGRFESFGTEWSASAGSYDLVIRFRGDPAQRIAVNWIGFGNP